jgi:hypothetical protein
MHTIAPTVIKAVMPAIEAIPRDLSVFDGLSLQKQGLSTRFQSRLWLSDFTLQKTWSSTGRFPTILRKIKGLLNVEINLMLTSESRVRCADDAVSSQA